MVRLSTRDLSSSEVRTRDQPGESGGDGGDVGDGGGDCGGNGGGGGDVVLNESRRKRAREVSAVGRKATPGPLRATKCACPATSPRRTADADATNGEPDPDATEDGNIDARSCFRLLMRLPVNDSSARVAEDGGLSCREAAETEPRLMMISSA